MGLRGCFLRMRIQFWVKSHKIQKFNKFIIFLGNENFGNMLKEYYGISRKLRLDAICKEREELENMDDKSDKYFPESRNERIKLLEEQKRLLEEAENIKLKAN